jgi:Bacterial lectin
MKSYALNLRQFSILLALILLSTAVAPSLFAQISIGSGGFNSTNVCSSTPPIPAGCQVATNPEATLSGTALQLTTNMGNQFGSAWAVAPQTVANGFSTTFTFQFTNPSTPPADGIAFVIQNAPSGLAAIGYTGGNGGAIGYGGDDANEYLSAGIPNSLAIELDSYQNGWDPNANHMAVQSCGTTYNTSHHYQNCDGSIVNSGYGDSNLAIGTPSVPFGTDTLVHTVMIQYNPYNPPNTTPCNAAASTTNNLCIYLDPASNPTPVLTLTVNLSTLLNLGAGGTAYVGFTGATGGDWETQDILSWTFNQTIVGTAVNPDIPATLVQNFNFSTPTAIDVFTVDLSHVPNPSTNLGNPNATPIITSAPVTTNPSSLWANSPLATAVCIPIISAGGNCAAKFELCILPGYPTPSGAYCPYDITGVEDSLLSDDYDPVTPITSFPIGQVPGVVALNDNQGCPFAAPFASLPCPSNGSKVFTGTRGTDPKTVHGSSNSAYYYVLGILPPSSAPSGFVNVNGTDWVNGNNNVQFIFTATPPATPSPNPTGFYPSPIDHGAYLVVPPTSTFVPDPTFPLTEQGGTLVYSSNVQTTSGTVISNGTSDISTCANVIIPSTGAILPADPTYSFPFTDNLGLLPQGGPYNAYYEAEDCTRTAERQYTLTTSSPPTWVTNYKSLTFNVDNTAPTISITSPVSGTIYAANTVVPSIFSCTDLLSGISPYGYCKGPNPINTTPTGGILTPKTFTVTSADNVGNQSSQSVNYSVSCLYARNTISPSSLTPGQTFKFYITPSATNCTSSSQALTFTVVLTGPLGKNCAERSLTLVPLLNLPPPTVTIPAGKSGSLTLGPFSVPTNACTNYPYVLTTTSSNKGTVVFTYSSVIND